MPAYICSILLADTEGFQLLYLHFERFHIHFAVPQSFSIKCIVFPLYLSVQTEKICKFNFLPESLSFSIAGS